MSKSGMAIIDKEKIRQNLIDCDCDTEIITKFMDAMEQGHEKEALTLLAKHRQDLLDQFHRYDNCIYCLDYLVSQIKKKAM